jgi:hypothetical protein
MFPTGQRFRIYMHKCHQRRGYGMQHGLLSLQRRMFGYGLVEIFGGVRMWVC